MSDRTRQPNHPTDDELLARLEAYAEAQLGPDPAGMARIRAVVLAEAARGAGDTTRPVPVWARLFGRVGRSGAGGKSAGARPVFVRRPALALMAASLAVVLVAGVAAAGGSAPGGPLYGARLWLETATLPADPAARTDAELARLEERIGEATTAAQSGDGGAVAAALEAYRATVDSTVVAADGDLTRQQRLEIALEQHQVVLETLVTELSKKDKGKDKDKGKASEAIQRALDKSAQTIERIMTETPRDKGGKHGPGGDPGKPSGRSDHSRAPGGSPGPDGPGMPAPTDGGPGMPTP